MLEPAHRLAHQLRRATQVPLRIGDVDMAEVGGQDRQAALRILVGPIPPHERIRSEAVSHIVQTWPVTVGEAAQTDLPG